MAVPLSGHLAARERARYHVQLELHPVPDGFRTPSEIPVSGRVVRVFRSDGTLAVGDGVWFKVHVHRGDLWGIAPGGSATHYDRIRSAKYVEAYLNGCPPECQSPLDEWQIIESPSDHPQVTVTQLQQRMTSRTIGTS